MELHEAFYNLLFPVFLIAGLVSTSIYSYKLFKKPKNKKDDVATIKAGLTKSIILLLLVVFSVPLMRVLFYTLYPIVRALSN